MTAVLPWIPPDRRTATKRIKRRSNKGPNVKATVRRYLRAQYFFGSVAFMSN